MSPLLRRERLALVVLGVLTVSIAVAMVTWGGSALSVVGGVGLLVATALLGWCAMAGWTGRTTAEAPRPARGREAIGLELPVRRGYAAALALGTTCSGLAALGIAVLAVDDAPGRTGLVLLASPFLVGAGLLVAVGAVLGRGRIRLDPHGMSYAGFLVRRRRIAWRDLRRGDLDETKRDSVLLLSPRMTSRRIVVPLHGQAWPVEVIAELVTYYATHAGSRAELSGDASAGRALERWRT